MHHKKRYALAAWLPAALLIVFFATGCTARGTRIQSAAEAPTERTHASFEVDAVEAVGTRTKPARACRVYVPWKRFSEDSLVADDVTAGGVVWCAEHAEAPPAALLTSDPDDVVVFLHGSGLDVWRNAVLRMPWCFAGGSIRNGPRPHFVAFLWGADRPASVLAYAQDRQRVPYVARAFAKFLTDLVRRSRPARLRILAHSVGVQIALEAAWLISPSVLRRVQEIMLISGDVEEGSFIALVPRWGYAKAVTVVGSSNDAALRLAEIAHRSGRVGQFTPRFRRRVIAAGCIRENIRFVDASALGSVPSYGHGFWGSVAIVDRVLWGLGARASEDGCFETLSERRRPRWSKGPVQSNAAPRQAIVSKSGGLEMADRQRFATPRLRTPGLRGAWATVGRAGSRD